MLDLHQPPEQIGFRKKQATCDHIFVFNQVLEKAQEYNFHVYLAFIDLNKVLDTIYRDMARTGLTKQGIHPEFPKILSNFYKNSTAYIKTDRKSKTFQIH